MAIDKEEFEKNMEEYGIDYKKILADIEQIVADIYKREGRKPTHGEIMASLICDYGYTNHDAEEEAISYATRGMM